MVIYQLLYLTYRSEIYTIICFDKLKAGVEIFISIGIAMKWSFLYRRRLLKISPFYFDRLLKLRFIYGFMKKFNSEQILPTPII